jgi:exopolysaccharide biosynthesis polyprenyl glycosylphosphotransferase
MYGTRGRSRASFWFVGVVCIGVTFALVTIATHYGLGFWERAGLTAALFCTAASTGVLRWWWMQGRVAEAVRPRRRCLVIGAGSMAQHLAGVAETEGWEVLNYMDYLQSASDVSWGEDSPLPDLVRDLGVERVLVADGPSLTWDLVEQIDRPEAPVEVFVVPSAYELALGRPTSLRIGDVALLRLSRGRSRLGARIAKRVFDVAVSLLILIVLAPVLLLALLAIRLGSPGPALFRQERVGKDGERFEIVKFRTMIVDAERDGPKLCEGKNDPRLTVVGSFLRRTHLDEVPQLWNVLRGEMSLVGPRPERPVFVEKFIRELPRYNERHRIAPGITGLAQVNGYYHSSPREKLRYDLMYLYHQSVWLDIQIIVRTALGVFK